MNNLWNFWQAIRSRLQWQSKRVLPGFPSSFWIFFWFHAVEIVSTHRMFWNFIFNSWVLEFQNFLFVSIFMLQFLNIFHQNSGRCHTGALFSTWEVQTVDFKFCVYKIAIIIRLFSTKHRAWKKLKPLAEMFKWWQRFFPAHPQHWLICFSTNEIECFQF